MGLFNKLNKALKDNFDIDIEKQTKQLLANSLNEIKDTLSEKLNGKGTLLNGAKVLINSKNPTHAPKTSVGTKSYTSVYNTTFVKIMAEKYLKETVAVDDKGDVTATLTQANKKPMKWKKKYTIFPDSVIIESESLQYPKNFNAGKVAESLEKNVGNDIEIRKYNDNTIRLHAEIVTDDGMKYYNKLIRITMVMHEFHQMLAEEIEREHDTKVEFTTEMISKLLDNENLKYSVDGDGDIKEVHKSACDKPIKWFTWYYIQPFTLTLDSGSDEITDDFDIDYFVNQYREMHGFSANDIEVSRTKKGSRRIKCHINLTSAKDVDKKWRNLHMVLEILWGCLYDHKQSMKQREEERRKNEEAKARLSIEEEQRRNEERGRKEEKEGRRKPEKKRGASSSASSSFSSFDSVFIPSSTSALSSSSSGTTYGKQKQSIQMEHMRIVKVEKGMVISVDQYGCQVTAPFHPNCGGDASFADYNQTLEQVVVTTTKGIVALYDKYNGQIKIFSSHWGSPVRMARWTGNDLVVTLCDGRTLLTETNGSVKKFL